MNMEIIIMRAQEEFFTFEMIGVLKKDHLPGIGRPMEAVFS